MQREPMAHVLAILGNDPAHLPCQVARIAGGAAGPARVQMGPEGEALGLGYYSDDSVLLAKRPGGIGSRDLGQLAAQVRSSALIALSQQAHFFDEARVDPFRFRRWLFAMDGAIELPRFREALVALLPPLLSRGLEVATDREHLFALALGELREQARLDDPDVTAADVARALAGAVHSLDRLARDAGVTRPAPLSAVLTNGRVLVAVRRGRPLSYSLLEGLAACSRCGLDEKVREDDPSLAEHRRAKAVVLATEPAAGAGFVELPDGGVLAIGRGLELATTSL